jgi:hypothetical protein
MIHNINFGKQLFIVSNHLSFKLYRKEQTRFAAYCDDALVLFGNTKIAATFHTIVSRLLESRVITVAIERPFFCDHVERLRTLTVTYFTKKIKKQN